MITITTEGNIITYASDNGNKVIVERINKDLYNVTSADGTPITQSSFDETQEAVRMCLNAIPLKKFLHGSMVSQKGLAIAAGSSVNYLSHIATGRRPSSQKLNEAIEKALRKFGAYLSTINII